MESYYYGQYKEGVKFATNSEVYHQSLLKETNIKDMGELSTYLAQKIKRSKPKMKFMDPEEVSKTIRSLDRKRPSNNS